MNIVTDNAFVTEMSDESPRDSPITKSASAPLSNARYKLVSCNDSSIENSLFSSIARTRTRRADGSSSFAKFQSYQHQSNDYANRCHDLQPIVQLFEIHFTPLNEDAESLCFVYRGNAMKLTRFEFLAFFQTRPSDKLLSDCK